MSDNAKDTSQPDFIIDDVDLADPELKGWDGVGGASLPPGEYLVEIIGASLDANQKGDGRSLTLDLQVKSEGEHYDATCKHWITMPSASHKDKGVGAKKRLAHVVRDTLGVALHPQTGGFAGADLIGRRMLISVRHETSTTYDAATNQEVTKTRMRIEAERPDPAAVVPTQPAPARGTQAARPANAQPAQGRKPAAAPPAARRG